jgi:hypothetical protein
MTSTNKFCKDLISFTAMQRYCFANETHSYALDSDIVRDIDKRNHMCDYVFYIVDVIIAGKLVVEYDKKAGYINKVELVSGINSFDLGLGMMFISYKNDPVRIYGKIAHPVGLLYGGMLGKSTPARPRWERMVAMRDAYTNYFAGWGLDFKHPCKLDILQTMIDDSLRALREWLRSHENVAGTLLWYLPRDVRLLIADIIMSSVPRGN